MKNTDIAKIRQLLKSIVKYYTKKDGQSNAPFSVQQKLKQALALLPCETCDGSGKKQEYTKVCPECGCPDSVNINSVGDGYRQCSHCHQDWWTDVKYAVEDAPCPDCRP